MNTNEYYASYINKHVSMRDAVAKYVAATPKLNRIPCPIHGGDNYNLHFNDNLYYCHVCHDGGDVIKFVRHVLNVSFISAINTLNADFALGLAIGRKPTLREQREAEIKQREYEAERAKREAEKQAYNTLYTALWGEFARLDKQRMMYKPTSADDEINPLYVEAVSNISNVCYRIDTLL